LLVFLGGKPIPPKKIPKKKNYFFGARKNIHPPPKNRGFLGGKRPKWKKF